MDLVKCVKCKGKALPSQSSWCDPDGEFTSMYHVKCTGCGSKSKYFYGMGDACDSAILNWNEMQLQGEQK